jgi:hypothetical protein
MFLALLALVAAADPGSALAPPPDIAAARAVAACFTAFAGGARSRKALQVLHACQMRHVEVLGLPALSDETAQSARGKASCLKKRATELERVSKELARKAGQAEGRELAFAVTHALLTLRRCQAAPNFEGEPTGSLAASGSSSTGNDDTWRQLTPEPAYRVELGPLVLAHDAASPADPLPVHRKLRLALRPPVFERCFAGGNGQPLSLVVHLRADGTVEALPA